MIDDKKIDIIILTINNRDNICHFLSAIKTQTVKPDKIIIMNTLKDEKDRSNLIDIDKDFVGIDIEKYIIYKKNFFHGKARNEGARYSDADYIVFMTDDSKPYDEYFFDNLYKGIAKNKDNNVALSYARHVAYPGATFTENKTREFNYPDNSIIKNKNTEKIYGVKNYFASNVC
ncbi:MAG: glycosyltransferase family 2 protein, partial [Lachnospiraceae bacterium]|nr:glycosyltransferase family 2 protein [Lachnospiraceae bacterium]